MSKKPPADVIRPKFWNTVRTCKMTAAEKEAMREMKEEGVWDDLRAEHNRTHSKEINESIFEFEFAKHPAIRKLNQRDSDIMGLSYVGMSMAMIARKVGCDPSTVKRTIKRVDPNGLLKATKEERREMRVAMADQNFTDSMVVVSEKLEDCSAAEAMRIGAQCAAIIQSENQTKHKEKLSSMDSILDAIGEVVPDEK